MTCTNLKDIFWLVGLDRYGLLCNQNYNQHADHHQPRKFLQASSKSTSIPIQRQRLFWPFSITVCSKISYKRNQTKCTLCIRHFSVFLRIIHVAACTTSLFLFISENCPSIWTHRNIPAQFPTDKHVGCSQFWAIMNKAALNILVQKEKSDEMITAPKDNCTPLTLFCISFCSYFFRRYW